MHSRIWDHAQLYKAAYAHYNAYTITQPNSIDGNKSMEYINIIFQLLNFDG